MYLHYRLNIIWILASMFVFIISNSCKKEVGHELVDNSTFMRIYPDSSQPGCFYASAMPDNSALLFILEDLYESKDQRRLSCKKLDPSGNLTTVSTCEIERVGYVFARQCKDGGFICTASSSINAYLIRFSAQGEILWITNVYPSLPQVNYYMGNAIECPDGNFRCLATTGPMSASTYNMLISVSSDGEYLGYIPFSGAAVMPENKQYASSLYNYSIAGTQFYTGPCYMKSSATFNWAQEVKPYVLKVAFSVLDTSLAFSQGIVLDSDHNGHTYDMPAAVYTKDRKLMMIVGQTNGQDITRGVVYQINDVLEIEWLTEIYFGIGSTHISKELFQTKEGNFVVSGSTNVPGSTSLQGFVSLIDGHGQIIRSKVFDTNLLGLIDRVVQTSDGNYFLIGRSNGFGQGLNGVNLMVIKTDANFNYKK